MVNKKNGTSALLENSGLEATEEDAEDKKFKMLKTHNRD
jgi:hypothetical protein